MNFINYLFDKSEYEDIANSLGNMILSGVRNEGVDKTEKELVRSILNHNRTLVFFNNCISREGHDELCSFFSAYPSKKVFDLSLTKKENCLNILEAFDSANDKSNFLMQLITMVSDVSDAIKSKIRRIFYYAMDALDKLGRKYKLNDLTKLDLDYIIEITNEAEIEDLEKRRRLRLLSDATTYSVFFELEDCWDSLNILGFDEAFSGDLSPKEILNHGNIVLINGFAHEEKKSRETYLNAFMLVYKSIVESVVSSAGLSTILKNSDFISIELLGQLFELGNSINSKVYMFVEDISQFIMKYGNAILDDTKSFMVFTQGSESNAGFWSGFFGSRDMQERSYSFTKKKSWNPFASSWDSGGVVASPRKYSSTTQNIQTVNKPIYRPEIFRELRPNDVMIYLREPLIRRKSRIEG